ncbi:MAG: WD40/YVTN/BNR-like repeat-containing protein [Acidobacteriota bacterium]
MDHRPSRFVLVLVALLLSAAVPAGTSRAGEPEGIRASQTQRLDAEALSGLQLRSIGPAIMSGRFVDIEVVESDPYTFYVAAATGGVWKTINNGVTFAPVFERQGTHSVGDIAVFQPDPDIVWVGTGERANRQSSSWGDGIYKSTDGGKTWTNMGLRDSHHIGRIVTHPSDPDIVYVAAMGHLWGPNEERGLYKSSDGGRSWDRILHIDRDTGVVDVAMDPADPDILYAAAYQRRRRAWGFHGGGPGSGLYKSSDGGRSWKQLSHVNGLPEGDYGRIGISVYRRDPRIVYVSIEQGRRYTASTSYEERLAGVYRSEDRGEHWQFMSDWNPRPMYASQILVDPNDDQRIYMENSFSVSEDGGKTFRRIRQTIHGDDRFLWVDPNDSRHLIKASDGAIGISYDRGDTWLFVESLPVSQLYRISVDMRHPYWVYGGLQDNGSWAGPSATRRAEGIINEDWFRTGGGDGFFSLAHPADPQTLFVESQFLGLTRLNLTTHETRSIRPGNDQGYLGGRRNWDVWGQDKAMPLLGNNMLPANWDGPVALSPHDPDTIYAGTNELFKSTDRGDSWTSLGDLTTRIDRVELTIMGRHPTAETLSLDDGTPYYPTLTYIAESPLRLGLLVVGTDDGNVQVSRDGGASWTNVAGRFPGLPPNTWVAGLEPSRYQEGTVYAVFDGHRNDDYDNYLYKSTDYGQTWKSIVADLPPRRVLRAIKEDPRNPDLLYVAAELGFFLSIDGGQHWVEFKGNLPTLAVNDFVIHPRDNDLVLATHGRGVWILDKLSSLQELTPEVLSSTAHLFSMETAEMIRYRRLLGSPGNNIFYGQNPPDGAIIDYWLGAEVSADEISIAIVDASGAQVATVEPTRKRGINRVVWDLRHASLSPPAGRQEGQGGFGGGGFAGNGRLRGPYVVPGRYTVRLTVDGSSTEQPLEVREDPRLEIGPAARRAWTHTLRRIGGMYEAANRLVATVIDFDAKLEGQQHPAGRVVRESKELRRLTSELRRRIRTLYAAISGWTGGPTVDQQAQMRFFAELIGKLRSRVDALTDAENGSIPLTRIPS